MHFDRDHLTALQEVAARGSFEAAAAALGLSQPAISLRIRALEDRVGLPLIQRGVPCTPTKAGTRLVQHAQTLALLEHATLADLDLSTGATPARVPVAVNADSLATWFPHVLADLDGLLVEVVSDDQDHSTDWLQRGEVSAAVTGSDKPAKGCDVTALGHFRYVAVASVGFVNTWFADGVTADTLGRAPSVRYSHKDGLQARWMHQITGKPLFPPEHVLPSTHGFLTVARAGIAWCMNPISLVQNDLKNGTLVELVPDSPLDIPLFWQSHRRLKTALAPLEKAIRRVTKGALSPPS